MPNIDNYVSKALELAMDYGPRLVFAIATLILGLMIIRGVVRMVGKIMERGAVNPTLRPFLQNLSAWLLKALLLISVASMVGIETTSFVAMLGAAGLAVGLALQGSLSNFGWGFDHDLSSLRRGRSGRSTRTAWGR